MAPYGAGGYPPPQPGQQVPYGGPYQYGQQGYGQPQPGQPPFGPPFGPPQPKSSRLGLYIFLSCVGVAALIGVIGVLVLSLSSSTSSSTSSSPAVVGVSGSSAAGSAGSSPAAAGSTSGGVGTSFTTQDNSGHTYRVTLVKIIDPAQGANQFYTAAAGKRLVGAVFTITAVQGTPQDEDANLDATMVGGNGQSYTADFAQIAGYTNFSYGTIKVSQGQSVTGAVTFQIPTGVQVTRVQWTGGAFGNNAVTWNLG